MRIDIRRGEQLKDGTTVVGNRTKVEDRQEQGCAALPHGGVRHSLRRGHLQGRQPAGSWPWSCDIIHKCGAWFSYGDQRIGQGRENTRKFLKENPEIAAEIDKLVRAELMGKNAPIVQSASDDDEEKPADDSMDDLPNLDDEE